MVRQKWDTAQVRAAIEGEGWAIADPEWKYENNETIIPMLCSKGHKADKSWHEFRSGNRCAVCSKKVKYKEADVRAAIEAEGWTIDPGWVYKNSVTIIPMYCDKGHRADKHWSSFKRGVRCAVCSKKTKPEEADVRAAIEAEGWTIDPGWTYKNKNAIIPMFCSKGHKADKHWSSFKRGVRCSICYHGEAWEWGSFKIEEKLSIGKVLEYLRYQHIAYDLDFDREAMRSILQKRLHPRTIEIYSQRYSNCHVDHIIPASWFDFGNNEEMLICFDPANLRVIPAYQNIARQNKLTLAEAKQLPSRVLWVLSKASKRPRSPEWDKLANVYASLLQA